MLEFLCCKATEIGAQTEELVSTAKAKVKSGINDFTQAKLSEGLVGPPTQWVHEGPDVYVMITDVQLKDGVEFTSLNAFVLRGVDCKLEVKIMGSKTQMAGMVAAQQAGKLFDFMSQGEKALTGALGVSSKGLAEKAAASSAGVAEDLKGSAATGADAQVFEFEVVLDLEKVAGMEQVKATVISVNSDTAAFNKVMSTDVVKVYIETAVSQRASRIVTDWQNQTFTLDRAKAQGGVLIASGLKQGGELLETAKAKGPDLEGVKAKLAETAETAKAKGAEAVEAVKAKAATATAKSGGGCLVHCMPSEGV